MLYKTPQCCKEWLVGPNHFFQLFQCCTRIGCFIRLIRGNSEKVKAITINDQLNVFSKLPIRSCREQSLECGLLAVTKSVQNSMAIGKVEIADHDFEESHTNLVIIIKALYRLAFTASDSGATRPRRNEARQLYFSTLVSKCIVKITELTDGVTIGSTRCVGAVSHGICPSCPAGKQSGPLENREAPGWGIKQVDQLYERRTKSGTHATF